MKKYRLLIDRAGTFEEVRVPAEDYPGVIVFPQATMSAYLDGRPYAGGIDLVGLLGVYLGGPRPDVVARKLATRTLRFVHTFRRATFQQLLMKVAYGCTVLQLGLDNVAEGYVLPALFQGTE